MKKLIILIVEKVHRRIFGHEISDQMRGFLNNLSWSFYGGILALPVTVVVGTLAGRFMGPEQYGKYNLVVLISTYVITFSFLGLDISTVKNIAKAKTEEDKERSFSSSAVFVLIMTAIFASVGLVFGSKIAGYFGLDKTVILFVVIYALIVSPKLILDVLVRALEKFKLQALGRTIEIAVLALGFIFVTTVFRKLNFQLYFAIILFGAFLVTILYFGALKKYFKNFSFEVLRRQLSEGKFFMLSGILGTIFLSSDRLFVTRYMGLTALGIYSAYYAASLGLVTSLSAVLTNVLFPATAKTSDKTFIYKIETLCLKSFIPIYLFVSIAIFIFLKIFGKAYPLKLSYLLLFALVATLSLFQMIYSTIILDGGRKRFLQNMVISNVLNLLNIVYYFVLLPYTARSVDLILIGYAVNVILSLVVQVIVSRKMIKDSQNAVL